MMAAREEEEERTASESEGNSFRDHRPYLVPLRSPFQFQRLIQFLPLYQGLRHRFLRLQFRPLLPARQFLLPVQPARSAEELAPFSEAVESALEE